MTGRPFQLKIISPEGVIFDGEVAKASFPGALEPFMVLYNHAPLISTLKAGKISWSGAKDEELAIEAGFVEVNNNIVVACVERNKYE